MLHNGRKCLGVFVNRDDEFFFDRVCCSVQAEGKRLGYDVYFFMTVSDFNVNREYDRLEMKIFNMAPVEKMDAIIVLKDLFLTPGLVEQLMYMIESRVKCPTVYIRYVPDGCDGVCTDEVSSFGIVIKHLIEHHGCKRIAMLAGPKYHLDAEYRLQCYNRTMAEYGMEVHPEDVFRGDMRGISGEEAYHHFFELNEKPDAIVCANDYMALDLARTVINHGLRIPEDVLITGFDDVIEATEGIPSLTTMSRDYDLMAKEAVRLIDRKLKRSETDNAPDGAERVYLPTVLEKRESCGCQLRGRKELFEINQNKSTENYGMKRFQREITYFSIDCSSCERFEQLEAAIVGHAESLEGCTSIHICTYDDVFSDDGLRDNVSADDSGVTLTISCTQAGQIAGKGLHVSPSRLLPEEIMGDSPQAYYIMMLHNGNDSLGYLAIQYEDGYSVNSYFCHYVVLVANALQGIRHIRELERMSAENYLCSITDPLTGLNNRRGFNIRLDEVWDSKCKAGESVAFICIDLDNLKYINDTFGHDAGDKAICAVAGALSLALPIDSFVARTGGDEFEVFLSDCDEDKAKCYMRRVTDDLSELSGRKEQRFDVSVSEGTFITTLDSASNRQECLRSSDMLMYQKKRRKKQNQKRS